MSEQTPTETRSRFYRWLTSDWGQVLGILAGCGLLVTANINPEIANMLPIGPAIKIAILVAMVSMALPFAILGERYNQKVLEDYNLQNISRGAPIAITTTVLINVAWEIWFLFVTPAYALSGNDLIAILFISWGIGYFYYRIRGLNQ